MVMENDNELLHCILFFVVFCSLKGVGTVPYCTIILYKFKNYFFEININIYFDMLILKKTVHCVFDYYFNFH